MSIKVNKRVINEVNYSDLEKLIEEHFGKPNGITEECNLPSQEEWSNDINIKITVEKEMSPYAEGQIKDMISKKEYTTYSLNYIMNWLCKEGKIEAGKYMISVSW